MGALAGMVDENDGGFEVTLQVAQAGEQRCDLACGVFGGGGEPEGPAGVVGRGGPSRTGAACRRPGQDARREPRRYRGCRDRFRRPAALANDVGSVFGGEQQNAAGSSGEAPQAGRAGRDGDCEVESEKGFAALRLADADRLLAPQLFDEPASLLRLFGEFRGPTGGESIHDRAPLRLSGVKISKNSFSSSSVALGGRGEQAVGHPGEGAVVAGGMIAKDVLKALRHEIRVAGLLEEVVEAGGEFLSFGVGQALGGTPGAATRRAAACR